METSSVPRTQLLTAGSASGRRTDVLVDHDDTCNSPVYVSDHGGQGKCNGEVLLEACDPRRRRGVRDQPFNNPNEWSTRTRTRTAFTPPAFAAPDPYGGVGLEIYIGPDKLPAIVEFLPTKKTGPAHDAGFMLNDKILEVDGAATTDLGGLKGVADALRGDAGTDVDVTVGRGRGKAPLTVEKVTMKREEITPNPRSCFVGSCARV